MPWPISAMPRCASAAAVYDGDTPDRALDGDRAQGELEPRDRHRLCAHEGSNQRGETVLSYRALGHGAQARQGRAGAGGGRARACRERCRSILPRYCPPAIDLAGYDTALAGSAHLWDDYEPGERIDHVDGMTIEESCHMTRDAALPEHRQGPFQPACGEGRALRPAHRLWRPCHQPGPRPQLQRPGQCLPHRRASMAAATSIPASPGTRSMPGARCKAKAELPGRGDAARCACGPSPPRTGPAPIFPPRGPRSCSTSTTPRSCPGALTRLDVGACEPDLAKSG